MCCEGDCPVEEASESLSIAPEGGVYRSLQPKEEYSSNQGSEVECTLRRTDDHVLEMFPWYSTAAFFRCCPPRGWGSL